MRRRDDPYLVLVLVTGLTLAGALAWLLAVVVL